MKPHILYGMPGSLYTGKVRSYLRKQGIGFEERTALTEVGLASLLELKARRVERHRHFEVWGAAPDRSFVAPGEPVTPG